MRAILVVLLLAGCTEQPRDDLPVANSRVATFEWPGAIPPSLDVLVVLEATPELAPYHARVDALMHEIADRLEPANGTPLQHHDLHVAVTTGGGALHHAAQVHGDYLLDIHNPDGSRMRDYDGELGDALAALADVGTTGTATAPITAAVDALDTSSWLRSDAPLAIVIVSTHDDGGTLAVADAAATLKATKSDPTKVVVTGAYAMPAPRLDAFVAQFPNRSSTIAIDAADYAPITDLFTQLIKAILAVPCMTEPLDVDPATPGGQYDCTISIVREDGVEILAPQCPGVSCWSFNPDPLGCSFTGGGNIEVAPYHWPVHPHLRGQCLVSND